ncbi:uncharacterized protein LOC128737594 [Sabethes cyaneus]|uniref:uncharacterized protein LOC128737594 n=1 Tax=Sabethes cyaneus TaxID=53552 RepID=UPI00237E500E|nr:uncharacterized protein LOC128737594 [Sabethes cyaneus]
MKVQYDLEGAVIEQPKPKKLAGWRLRLKLVAVLLVALMFASAVGTFVYQRYYERHSDNGFELMVHDGDSQEEVTSEKQESSSSKDFITSAELDAISEDELRLLFSVAENVDSDGYEQAENSAVLSAEEPEKETWEWEGDGILGFRLRFEDGKWGFETPVISEDEKVTENDIESVHQEESNLSEAHFNDFSPQSDNKNSNTAVWINPNAEEDFGAEAAIMQFELNEQGLSIKYGNDENNMKELQHDSGIGWLARLMLQELFLAVEQSSETGNKVDLPAVHVGDEIWNWSSEDGQMGFKFRFGDDQWSFEPAVIEKDSSEGVLHEISRSSSTSDSKEDSKSNSRESDKNFSTALDSSDDSKS